MICKPEKLIFICLLFSHVTKSLTSYLINSFIRFEDGSYLMAPGKSVSESNAIMTHKFDTERDWFLSLNPKSALNKGCDAWGYIKTPDLFMPYQHSCADKAYEVLLK